MRCEGDQGLDGRHFRHQRRGVDGLACGRVAISGTAGREAIRVRRCAGTASFQHQLGAATPANPVAGTAALVTAAATTALVTATATTAPATVADFLATAAASAAPAAVTVDPIIVVAAVAAPAPRHRSADAAGNSRRTRSKTVQFS